jgi:hypothetical protein
MYAVETGMAMISPSVKIAIANANAKIELAKALSENPRPIRR